MSTASTTATAPITPAQVKVVCTYLYSSYLLSYIYYDMEGLNKVFLFSVGISISYLFYVSWIYNIKSINI